MSLVKLAVKSSQVGLNENTSTDFTDLTQIIESQLNRGSSQEYHVLWENSPVPSEHSQSGSLLLIQS